MPQKTSAPEPVRGGCLFFYASGKACPAFISIFTCRETVFKFAFLVAFPCGLLTAVLKALDEHWVEEDVVDSIVVSEAYSSFVFLLSMLTVFRTSQSYSRYWNGIESAYMMMADFFDVASSLCAFCKMSEATVEMQARFQHTIVRLFSLLHALILAELALPEPSGGAIPDTHMTRSLSLIEFDGLSIECRTALMRSKRKIDLVFQWIQSLMVISMNTKVITIPPPILSRCFQELNSGMSNFERCLTIVESPFPFPYTAASEMILLMHWFITPLIACTWTDKVWSAFILAFAQVFVVWSLHSIAAELENPFEGEEHDLDTAQMQEDLNWRLVMLLNHTSSMVPTVDESACLDTEVLQGRLRTGTGGYLADLGYQQEDLRKHRSNGSAASSLDLGRRGTSARSSS